MPDFILIILGFIAVLALVAGYFVSVANGSFERAVYWFADRFGN
jgi:hypothetical protein